MAVPPVVVPVQVQLALRAVPVEVRHVAVAVAILPHGAVYKISSLPPPLEFSQGCIVFGIYNPPIPCTKYCYFKRN